MIQTHGSFAYIASINGTCQHQGHAQTIASLRYQRSFRRVTVESCVESNSHHVIEFNAKHFELQR